MIFRYQDNCKICANYSQDQRCKAFPDGIPDELWSGENLHRQSYSGDNGIHYEPKNINFPEIDNDFLKSIGA
jgi:hypothetical protein